MLKREAMDHFKNASNIARALHITPAAVWKWGEIVPWFSAKDIERITSGAVRVREELYVRGRPLASIPPNYAA